MARTPRKNQPAKNPLNAKWRIALVILTFAGCQTPRGAIDWPGPTSPSAILTDVKKITDGHVGAAQGLSVHEGRLYIYGDVSDTSPRAGVIREYDLDGRPTGREVSLRRRSVPVATHPTGLTWDEKWGTYLGDTVGGVGRIVCIDWRRAWEDGNLDHAVICVIRDDATINGSRPEFVTLNGRRLLASADYGNSGPEIRLYDPEVLLKERRTAVPNAIVARMQAAPFNQNLYWNDARGELVCIQNVVAGRGWRLATFNLKTAVIKSSARNTDPHVSSYVFPEKTELEGYRPLPNGRAAFVTASREHNLIIGRIRLR